jgi:hypothetical protein
MRKDEEFITNKKRFYDEFSDKNVEKKEVKPEKIDIISSGMIFSLLKLDFYSKFFYLCLEEYDELFGGNVDDFFRIGMSISKKTLKLYTDFYSSDLIIASPVGLKSIIGSEE